MCDISISKSIKNEYTLPGKWVTYFGDIINNKDTWTYYFTNIIFNTKGTEQR